MEVDQGWNGSYANIYQEAVALKVTWLVSHSRSSVHLTALKVLISHCAFVLVRTGRSKVSGSVYVLCEVKLETCTQKKFPSCPDKCNITHEDIDWLIDTDSQLLIHKVMEILLATNSGWPLFDCVLTFQEAPNLNQWQDNITLSIWLPHYVRMVHLLSGFVRKSLLGDYWGAIKDDC